MNNNRLFLLDLPDGWKETTVYTFEGPDDSGLKHNLAIVTSPKESKDLDLVSFVKSQVATCLEGLSGFEMLSEQQITFPNRTPGYQICYKYVPTDNVILFQKQLFIETKDAFYVCASTYTKKTLQTIALDVDKIIASLRIISPKALLKFIDDREMDAGEL